MNGKTVAVIVGVSLTFGLGWFFLHRKKVSAAEGWIRDICIVYNEGGEIIRLYPLEGQSLIANSWNTIDWSAFIPSGNFNIQYHIEGEDNPFWVNVGVRTSVGVEATYGLWWQVPDKAGQDMSIKISAGSIAEQVDNIHITSE